MNFDLLDDAMLNDGFGNDESFDFEGVGGLILDEIAGPPDDGNMQSSLREVAQDQQRGMSEHSWDDLIRCVSDQSDDDITNDERDEIQEFLKDVGIAEPPIRGPDTFECWGATISPVSEEQKVEPVGNTPFAFDPIADGQWPIDPTMSPPEKRRRMQMPPNPIHPVTPPTPDDRNISTMPIVVSNMPSIVSPPTRRCKDTNKNRTTRQFVPFEEMQRLMAEYGPIKTPRKRKIKNNSSDEYGTGGTAKMESIKRKFYRWFPDFEERFVKNPDGFTYRPTAGHSKEVAYRLAMRNMDQESLVHKRKVGRKCDWV